MDLTGMSYDNTRGLGREHLAARRVRRADGAGAQVGAGVDLGMPAAAPPGTTPGGRDDATEVRWLMSSDVCKHCTHAACLDVCPTGALFRTEFGTVVVQHDICNGCGYCIPACPYGVIDQRTATAARSSARCATTGSGTA